MTNETRLWVTAGLAFRVMHALAKHLTADPAIYEMFSNIEGAANGQDLDKLRTALDAAISYGEKADATVFAPIRADYSALD